MSRSTLHTAPPPADGADASAISAYDAAQAPALRATCTALRALIDESMPQATSKIWHGSPVWFIGENPVVGYSVTKKGVPLLFWNGAAFDDDALTPVGKHGAAQAVFGADDVIDANVVRRWLVTAGANVLDSRAKFRELRQRR